MGLLNSNRHFWPTNIIGHTVGFYSTRLLFSAIHENKLDKHSHLQVNLVFKKRLNSISRL
ncbi:hypothetical protein T265_03359 [Opisthorchis viverrini]|uniref:Uncharacterized protein n=1 Tax=Opisthorchis viverrini TaxID=6198 RepID=A0A074ZWF2_OPIVI|nr:hypothetical protein T265_03359 [Opisthorchis viverrini]KER30207.1 hypothetical protein T265_03359 [Opisthorchis viverrini]